MGGGIQGVAVARDAALRGLRILLLEARDLASGTSSRTSKLVHGGIRYLETGQLGLVRESLRERALLLDLAPDFVRPLPFLIPHYRGRGRSRALVRIGLLLYEALSGQGGHRLGRPRPVSREEALALEPQLEPRGLLGASLFWDAQMEDAPLCVAEAMDAERAGAEVHTYTEVTALTREGSTWRVRARDGTDQAEREWEARWIVNAAGPWADRIRGDALGRRVRPSMRRTRGTHIVVPAALRGHALLLSAARDGRVFFALPWGAHALVGTTDVDDPVEPGRVAPPGADIRYLVEESASAVPALTRTGPVRAFAGLRSLALGRATTPWANTREHRLVEDPGMTTLIGGKYTTHRSLAERVVNGLLPKLGRNTAPGRTASTPIGAGRAERMLALARARPGKIDLPGGLSLSEAEVIYAAREERARHLEDILYRRTRLWLDGRALRAAAEPAARWAAPHLGWGEKRIEEELRRVYEALDAETAVIEEAKR